MSLGNRLMVAISLSCALNLLGCRAGDPDRIPVPKGLRIPASPFWMSDRERRICEKKALGGDILSARRMVDYYLALTGDDKQYHFWLKIVDRNEKRARLENATPK